MIRHRATTCAPAADREGSPPGALPDRATTDATRHTSGKSPAGKGVWELVGIGLTGGLVVLILSLAALVTVLPALAGAGTYSVLTPSMEPHLPPGTLVVVRPTEPEDLRIGDVITYQVESGKDTVITHRIVGIDLGSDGSRTYTTLGDNNSLPDPPVVAEQVRGRVWYAVPLIGSLTQLRSLGFLGVMVPVLGGALVLYGCWSVISWLRDRLRHRELRGGDPSAHAG